jgi:rhodanese-related sulfurtransferase
MSIEEIIKQNQGTIVDVRSHAEFMGGNVVGSINIALNEFPTNRRVKKSKSTINTLLCFWQQKWSSSALSFSTWVECYNGGGWLDVNYYNLKQQNKMINTLKKNYLASDLKWITRHY